MGSYWSNRLAAHDPRVKAIASSAANYGTKKAIFEEASPRFKQIFMYMAGIHDEAEFDAMAETMHLYGYGAKVKCYSLMVLGEYDPLCHLEEGLAYFDEVAGPKEIWILENENHVPRPSRNFGGMLADTLVADWLKDALLDHKPRDLNKVVFVHDRTGAGPYSAQIGSTQDVYLGKRIEICAGRPAPSAIAATRKAVFQTGNTMNLNLADKTALVTGASMGIGHAIARGLAAEGVTLCIAARRKNLLDELAARIVAAGGKPPHIEVIDVMEDGAVERLAQATTKALGRVDILINCAGGSRPAIPVDAPEDEWEEVMRLNFVRVRQLTHAILPGMIERRWGRVINISGKSEPSGLLSATPAKAAIHAWAKGLSREVGRHGITVNCIPPGRIMSEQIRRKYSDEFRARQSAEDIPVGRYGEPEELAALAVFLASPVASYITGAVMPVDGGLRRYAF